MGRPMAPQRVNGPVAHEQRTVAPRHPTARVTPRYRRPGPDSGPGTDASQGPVIAPIDLDAVLPCPRIPVRESSSSEPSSRTPPRLERFQDMRAPPPGEIHNDT